MLGFVKRRILSILNYQYKETNCGTCTHSKDWCEQHGKCHLLPNFILDVLEYGICKFHSSLHESKFKND
jgi:hypothetical protein